MRTSIIFVSALLFFSMVSAGVIAVSFTPTSSPTGLNTGQSSQLVNFSIQNTGGVNITQLNITLAPGFAFTGTSGTTTSNPYTASSTAPSWTNSSSVGIVGNSATQYFWIYVNTPSSTGSYGFNVTTLDANAAFSSSNVTFTLFDTLAPTYSSNTTSPSSNTTYVANQSYWFNITWSDGTDISRVLLEHNITGSGTPHNETMSNSSNVYYLNVSDLSAGIYAWRMYANDTNNTFNSTPQFTYLIGRATNTLSIYLNGTLNGNITSINNTAVNITVSAPCQACAITIARDNTNIVSGVTSPYSKSDDVISSVGLHNYSVSVSSNTNYTSNSSTYFVATVPSYSATTSGIPLTFSNTTIGTIGITFGTNPSLANINIQGDWSGTATNYSMSNTSGLSYYYNTTFPAGTHTWKVYGVYANHSFNLTASNSFTINKNTPTLILNITPGWTIDSPIQTNVTCTQNIDGLTANLYRNGTSVTIPDVQTFSAGSIYSYLCNNTINQNYTANSVTNTLVIRPKSLAGLMFVQTPSIIEVTQSSSTSSEIKVKNTGNTAQNVTLEISGIDKSWYSVDKDRINIFIGYNSTFIVTFNAGNSDVKDYPAKFTATSSNSTISQDFTLRILPSNETKEKINDTIALYKLDISKLEDKFNEIKNKTNNTSTIEQKITELKSAMKQTEGYVNSNNYFQAQQSFETIKSLIAEIETQLKAAGATTKTNIPSRVWLIILSTVVVIAVVFVTYLFWPVKKGFKPEANEYVYGGGEEKKENIIDKIKDFLRFKRKKKSEVIISEE